MTMPIVTPVEAVPATTLPRMTPPARTGESTDPATRPSATAPETSVPIKFPWIVTLLEFSADTSWAPFPEMRFLSAGAAPPTVMGPRPLLYTPRSFATAADPAALVPMKQP